MPRVWSNGPEKLVFRRTTMLAWASGLALMASGGMLVWFYLSDPRRVVEGDRPVLLCGVVLAVVGLGLGSWMVTTVVDRRRGVLAQRWSTFLLLPLRAVQHPLSEFDAVTLSQRGIPNPKGPPGREYDVCMRHHAGRELKVASCGDPERSRRLAEELARFVSLPLEDRSLGYALTRQPDELDSSVGERIGEAGGSLAMPEAPARLVARCRVGGKWATFTFGREVLSASPGAVCLTTRRAFFLGKNVKMIPADEIEEVELAESEKAYGPMERSFWREMSTRPYYALVIRSDRDTVVFGDRLPYNELRWIKAVVQAIITAQPKEEIVG